MLCQQCQKRTANVHFTQIINGKKIELYLCTQCAKEKGHLGFSPQLNLGDFLWGIPAFSGGNGFPQAKQPEEVRCNVCGMSFEDFRKTGKLGCANCYQTFRDNLSPILRRIHGNIEHTGKVPGKASNCRKAANELEKLKAQLAAAIEKEEYEKAAELRDRIRELETTGNKC
ncbi:MAG: UvrB/UvrC motif-containing protein [Clostridiaceae bacterium]